MSLEDDEKLILANSQTLRDAGVGKNQRPLRNCHNTHQRKLKLGLNLASALASRLTAELASQRTPAVSQPANTRMKPTN